jgi:hypothetical protein
MNLAVFFFLYFSERPLSVRMYSEDQKGGSGRGCGGDLCSGAAIQRHCVTPILFPRVSKSPTEGINLPALIRGTTFREVRYSIYFHEHAAATPAMRATTSRRLLSVGTFLLAGMFAAPARSQQTAPSNPTISASPQELAKSVHNPFEDFIKVPLQSTTGFSIGPHHNAGDSLNLQPLLPLSLNRKWDLFARPSLSLNYQPSPHEQFGLTDLQTSFFLSPHNANEWVWGLGRSFNFRRLRARTGDGAVVRWPNRRTDLFEWPMVQRSSDISAHVVRR